MEAVQPNAVEDALLLLVHRGLYNNTVQTHLAWFIT